MNRVVLAIVRFLVETIAIVFSPIDGLIYSYLPVLSTVINYFNNFLTWLCQFVLWVLSWLPFNSDIWSWFIAYIIIKITVSGLLTLIKTAVKWWHYLAP